MYTETVESYGLQWDKRHIFQWCYISGEARSSFDEGDVLPFFLNKNYINYFEPKIHVSPSVTFFLKLHIQNSCNIPLEKKVH